MKTLWVEITATRGSAPRDAGTVMKVTPEGISGTIGGGALEFAAINRARRMLAAGETEHSETLPLGPNLGQCCGGAVTLKYTNIQPKGAEQIDYFRISKFKPFRPHPKHLWLWGAGHVGRAVVQATHPQSFKITWVDDALERFPHKIREGIRAIPAADMPLLATRAERRAHHLIFTYSHDIDLALCAALLRRGAYNIGLIGSETKWARFQKRLVAMGLDPSPITCPIGDKSLGKAPHQIAGGVVDGLLAEDRMSA